MSRATKGPLTLGLSRAPVYGDPSHSYSYRSPVKLGFIGDLPAVLTICGHFCSGKDSLFNELKIYLAERGVSVVEVPNYKGREPRKNEIEGKNYIRITSERHRSKLITDRKIVVPYLHDGLHYGLSVDIENTFKGGQVPLTITDEDGLFKYSEYMRSQGFQNRLVSFMLHAVADARNRLVDRLGPNPKPAELEGAYAHWMNQRAEIDRYRSHEDMFRHVLRNNAVADVTLLKAMEHLSHRVIDILDLEARLNAASAQEFRAGYAEESVSRLLKMPIKDLQQRLGDGKDVFAPDDSSTKAKVIGYSSSYGILSIYLEPVEHHQRKVDLVNAIKQAVKLTPQNFEMGLKPEAESTAGLKMISPEDTGLMDFLVSFSAYDPMRAPRPNDNLHTVTIESLWLNQNPKIIKVSEERAKKIIEGNGS